MFYEQIYKTAKQRLVSHFQNFIIVALFAYKLPLLNNYVIVFFKKD